MTFTELWGQDLTGTTYSGHIKVVDKGLTSLQGMPETVKGNLWISKNPITSLKYCPEYVEGDFDCDSMPNLIDFKHAPKSVGESFGSVNNEKLLRLTGLTKKIGGDLILSNNKIFTFKGVSEISILGNLFLDGTKFPSREVLVQELADYKIWFKRNVFSPFEEVGGADITAEEVEEYRKMKKKMGKFKDLLDL